MEQYIPDRQSRIDLERDLAQLDGTGLGEETPLCDTCKQPLTEGRRLTVYARRTADTATFELGTVTCFEHRHDQQTQFDTEARELVVEGCVGRCSDQAKQTSWPILLHPQSRVISPIGTVDGQMVSNDPWFRSKIAMSQPDDTYREINWTVSPPTSRSDHAEMNISTADTGGEMYD
jgi:hypothetical protein